MKWIIVVLSITAILVIGFFGFIIVSDIKDSNANKNTSTNSLEDIRDATGGSVTDEQLDSYEEKGLNPFGQIKSIDQLTDIDYQEYIHGMSHQKVAAEEKWGYYQITPDRVYWLLEGLDVVNLQHKETYKSILEKWANGDFSSADKDHNAIWALQGGTIGEATGILSPEEEKAFMESQR
ncbi:DUF6241 domain-containing protein [Ornithinibacillus californiensis]|uniref:DUF6241 domain-containing protein n=1 Tax=Ornithinibacillus californiensis TaxID=161536 RepID=UPI00069D6F65|nr:DUF6241 domain-containing protein [Ornithinibacillus californiensis]